MNPVAATGLHEARMPRSCNIDFDAHARAIVLGRLAGLRLSKRATERVHDIAGGIGRIRGEWVTICDDCGWLLCDPIESRDYEKVATIGLGRRERRIVVDLLDITEVVEDCTTYVVVLEREGCSLVLRHVPRSNLPVYVAHFRARGGCIGFLDGRTYGPVDDEVPS